MGYFLQTHALRGKKKQYSDQDVVLGLQARDREVEEWFYAKCRQYIMEKFDEIFFDRDKKQEVMQEAFIRLWTQIDDLRIKMQDGKIVRQQADGVYRPLSCSLLTFLMAIARNEYREICRSNHEEYYADFFGDENNTEVILFDRDEDETEEQKNRIVAECVCTLSDRCREILTLAYYQGKSLDEILALRSDKNTSKDGLKTAKNKCMNSLKSKIQREFERFHFRA